MSDFPSLIHLRSLRSTNERYCAGRAPRVWKSLQKSEEGEKEDKGGGCGALWKKSRRGMQILETSFLSLFFYALAVMGAKKSPCVALHRSRKKKKKKGLRGRVHQKGRARRTAEKVEGGGSLLQMPLVPPRRE